MVVISMSGDRVTLKAPFHPELSSRARGLRGRWQGEATGWTFAPDQEAALRGICVALWGVDGRPETAADTVSVRITVAETDLRDPLWRRFNEGIWLMGRELVSPVRNRPIVRPGRGVRFVVGGPTLEIKGIERWTIVANGCELVVSDVPRMVLPRMQDALAGHGSLVPILS